MVFDWRRLLGLNVTDERPADAAPLASAGVPRTYAVGDAIAGEYRVLDIFAGGMGRVYLVRHHNEDTPFVLKTLQRPGNDAERMQFLREAEIWVGLGGHRNIVRARFVTMLDGHIYVVADYVPSTPDRGNTLEAYVGCTGVPDGLLLTWVAEFCHGMAHAQSHGVVAHRDIKPGNLMLMPDNKLRITDFGLARSFTLPSGTVEGVTELRSISGTLPYMAPEQFLQPDAVDHRVDIYAFGITLYELIAGTLPFTASSQKALVQHVICGVPSALKSPLWPICERCLRKDPAMRYQTFQDLLTDASTLAREVGATIPTRPDSRTNDEELMYAKAMSYGAIGRPDLAMRYALKYSQMAPDDDRAWTELGKQYLAQNQLTASVEASLRSIRLAPFKSQARNNLGVALSRLGKFDEALRQLQVAASHDPLNTGALLNQVRPLTSLRRPLEAIEVMQTAIGIAPKKASIWAQLGAVQMEVGQVEEAGRSLKKALELHPGLPEAQENLRTLIARRAQKTVVEGRPDPARLLAMGRFSEAEAELLERVARNANDVDAWHNLGIIATHQQREREAIDRFSRVVAIKPDDVFARKQLVRLRAGAGDIAGALRECAELARIPDEQLHATLLRAQLLQGLGETVKAVQELQHLVQDNPELDQVWFMLSEIYERAGQFKESEQAARRGLALLRRVGGHADNIAMLEQRIARLDAVRR
ncbi:MAG: serine/threonine-protein kinase [Gammaproteobacteria bacterium]|nr:serine/threonine-protein kinase [Gammaproteobacteria bacterium]